MINNIDRVGAELNEAGEWIEVPLENILPKWLNLDDEEENIDFVIIVPYLGKEFRQWLSDKRRLEDRRINEYMLAYESAYESAYELLEFDLYDHLRSFMVEIPKKTSSGLTKECAPYLVKMYIDAMLEELDENSEAFSKIELLAMFAYHDFIADVVESDDERLLKEKSSPINYEDKFISWLEREYKMSYEYVKKIVSSVRRVVLALSSLVPDVMTFLESLRAMPQKKRREIYMELLLEKRMDKRPCFKTPSEKTILNGFVNLSYYLHFLGSYSL